MTGNNILDKDAMQKLNEVYIALLGIRGTGDQGCVGKINNIEKHLRTLNGSVSTNTTWRKAMVWVLGGVMIIMGFVLHAVVFGG